MFIKDYFDAKNPVLSLEVFPPKEHSGFEGVKSAIEEMSKVKFDYMSVTYGAGGTTAGHTSMISSMLEKEIGVTSLSHLTCVKASKEEIKNHLDELKNIGVNNILALRGDLPNDTDGPVFKDFQHASDLIKFIKENGDFCVGGACYPEMHPDSKSVEDDIESLKIKMDNGCDFLVTQMFFDNDRFYDFKDKCEKHGVNIPITAGIMPLTNIAQIKRMCVLSGGASMPSKFVKMIAKYSENPKALYQAGIAYAIDQIIDLVSNDTRGIHIYTMNKPDIAKKIITSVNEMF